METAQTSPLPTADTVATAIHRSTGVSLDTSQQRLTDSVIKFLHLAAQDSTSPGQPAGFFVYGPPGRGKTWLMTQLFQAAPFPAESKRHVHFHDFFRTLQQQLGPKTSMRQAIGTTLTQLLTGTELFLFDELHVHDPGSAALLNNLLAEITERGIPTLITSNYEPEGLLPDVMFHHVIEPSITLLRDHFDIRRLDNGTDYRAEQPTSVSGFASGRWLITGPEPSSTMTLEQAGLTAPTTEEAVTVLEGHRALRASAVRGTEIWFDFHDLLGARSITQDFLDLADAFDTWVLLNFPRLARVEPAVQQRFVTLIDVLVEHDLPLTVVAEAPLEETLEVAHAVPDLFRTRSRLQLLTPGP